MSSWRIVLFAVLAFGVGALAPSAMFYSHFTDRPADLPTRDAAAVGPPANESVHQRQEPEPAKSPVEAQRVAQEEVAALRRAFISCFGYAPPQDPLLMTALEKTELWLRLSEANAGGHDRCRR
jgi:hypothetical protein